ncbi:MAG: carboxypeptidase regulatory-like domain-containing protein, partial [Planctomycetales bacterium]|nr:carboxypeptidase regulatory-like domain-containing protein [Planctomycetales bacterium]
MHGRVYALDDAGKLLGTIDGADIEFKNQAGAIVARIQTEDQGYYQVSLVPGQYFYKVTAAGYKDEDQGRGFSLQRSEGMSIQDFALVKRTTDEPAHQPPQLPIVQIGRLQGHVWERTAQGELVGVPAAVIALRQVSSQQLTKVVTRRDEGEQQLRGSYEVILEEGPWHASASAPGFQTLVDPEPLLITSGNETERDFVLTRQPTPRPEGQGIRGIVRVRAGVPNTPLPADCVLHIDTNTPGKSGIEAIPLSPSGQFQHELAPNAYALEAVASGYRSSHRAPVFVLPGRYTVVELTLVPDASAPASPDDAAPDGPDVPQQPDDLVLLARVVRDSLEGPPRPLPGAAVLVRREDQPFDQALRGTADQHGEVRFALVEPGSYVALAQMNGYQPNGSRIDVAIGSHNETVITLRKLDTTPEQRPPELPPSNGREGEPVEVHGYVVYRDPQSSTGLFGVRDAQLLWRRHGETSNDRPRQISSQRTGDFSLMLAEGEYDVELRSPPGYRGPGNTQVSVALGMPTKYFYVEKVSSRQPDIEQQPTLPSDVQIRIQGYVVTPSNRTGVGYAAVAGAEVVWTPQGGSPGQARIAKSDTGGRFTLTLTEGAYIASVTPPSG